MNEADPVVKSCFLFVRHHNATGLESISSILLAVLSLPEVRFAQISHDELLMAIVSRHLPSGRAPDSLP